MELSALALNAGNVDDDSTTYDNTKSTLLLQETAAAAVAASTDHCERDYEVLPRCIAQKQT